MLIVTGCGSSHTWERASGRFLAIKPIRELIFAVWEAPRLPPPLLRSKYPLSAPWTPAARLLYSSGASKVSLEHVTPAAVMIGDLLDRPPPDVEALVQILQAIRYVVIAPDDDRKLNSAGVGSRLVPGSLDPWDRYRVAGLDPATFGPIESPS